MALSPEIRTLHEENAGRYRDIVENASDLIFTVDLDDRITSVNAAFERALGRSRSDLLGRPLSSVVMPAWHGQLRDATSAKLRRGPNATVYDLELLAEDGHPVPVEVSSWVVVEDGQPRAVQAICRDMSERNAAEEDLRTMRAELAERDDFLRRAFEDTAVSMVVTAADGVIERANQAFCELLGYAEAELRGTNMVDITHPDDRAMVLTAIGQLRSGELRRFAGEKRYRCKDGGTVRAQIGISPILSATGEVTSFISQILDVTEQRAVEAALRETGELFRAAFEDVEAGMMLVAPDGRIVQCNASVCELLGYTPEELRELDVVAITHPDDRDQTRDTLARLASGELKSQTLEKRYLRKSGDAVWARRSTSTVRDANGDLTCTVTQINDVSARRQSEERFRALFESSPQGMAVVDEGGSAPPDQRRARGDSRLRLERARRPQFHRVHAPGRLRGRPRALHRADGRPADALRAGEALPPSGRRGGLGAPDRVRATQSRRRPASRDRHSRRHHRAPRARGPASSVPAHGGGRAARRRRRA